MVLTSIYLLILTYSGFYMLLFYRGSYNLVQHLAHSLLKTNQRLYHVILFLGNIENRIRKMVSMVHISYPW